jgi:hypothetical protein
MGFGLALKAGASEAGAFKAIASSSEASRNDSRKLPMKIAAPGVAISAALH